MIYREEERDLFTLDSSCVLAHCISSDYALGAGIANVFNRKYGVRDALLAFSSVSDSWNGRGHCECVYSHRAGDGTGGWLVANLVTKEKYWHKPSYDTVRQALEDMKSILITSSVLNLNRIGMPLIGCGLDGLQWEKVSEIIRDVFADTDFEILVCRFGKD